MSNIYKSINAINHKNRLKDKKKSHYHFNICIKAFDKIKHTFEVKS